MSTPKDIHAGVVAWRVDHQSALGHGTIKGNWRDGCPSDDDVSEIEEFTPSAVIHYAYAAPQPQQIAEPASQWIGVNERLPVWVVRDDTPCFINGKEIPPTLFSETVLVALKGGGVRTDKLTTIEGKSEGWWHTYGERVAAWMLAPKPPTQKDPS